jgi:hypothetical protein
LLFSKTWADACNEDSQAKPFWIDFFEIFGITNKRVATFELNVKMLGGAQGFVDLFWPGVLLVEHKSRQKFDATVDAIFQFSSCKKTYVSPPRTHGLTVLAAPTHDQVTSCASRQENTKSQSH